MLGLRNNRAGRGGARRLARLSLIGAVTAAVGLLAVTAVWAANTLTASPARPARTLTIAAAPPSQTVSPGGTAHYGLATKGRQRLAFTVTKGLPSGAVASFKVKRVKKQARAKGRMVTLTVTTTAQTPAGSYPLQIRGKLARSVGRTAVQLVVASAPATAPPPPAAAPPGSKAGEEPATHTFGISGSPAQPLFPGAEEPLDLVLANNDDSALQVTALSVEIDTVEAPGAQPGLTCGDEDFAVTQFSGAYGFTLPASSTRSLDQLGVPSSAWPTVRMLELPANQNGCKNASLELSFGGTSKGGEA